MLTLKPGRLAKLKIHIEIMSRCFVFLPDSPPPLDSIKRRHTILPRYSDRTLLKFNFSLHPNYYVYCNIHHQYAK